MGRFVVLLLQKQTLKHTGWWWEEEIFFPLQLYSVLGQEEALTSPLLPPSQLYSQHPVLPQADIQSCSISTPGFVQIGKKYTH